MQDIYLYRGHGSDVELYYEANKNNYMHIVSSNFYVDYVPNRVYKMNKGGEDLDRYKKKPRQEMINS